MSYRDNILREPLLRAVLVPYSGTFKSGAQANNKLDFDRLWLSQHEVTRKRIIAAMAHLTRTNFLYHPEKKDAIVPVPQGANRFGREVARQLGTMCIELDKDPQTKQFSVPTAAQEALWDCRRVVLVEDVPNGLNSLREISELPELDGLLVGAVGGFDRGDRRGRVPLKVPLISVVQHYVPPYLEENSELWRLAA